MDIDNLTDDEAIAIALLLGAEFVHGPSTHKDWNYRYFKPWSVFYRRRDCGVVDRKPR